MADTNSGGKVVIIAGLCLALPLLLLVFYFIWYSSSDTFQEANESPSEASADSHHILYDHAADHANLEREWHQRMAAAGGVSHQRAAAWITVAKQTSAHDMRMQLEKQLLMIVTPATLLSGFSLGGLMVVCSRSDPNNGASASQYILAIILGLSTIAGLTALVAVSNIYSFLQYQPTQGPAQLDFVVEHARLLDLIIGSLSLAQIGVILAANGCVWSLATPTLSSVVPAAAFSAVTVLSVGVVIRLCSGLVKERQIMVRRASRVY